MPNVFVLEHWEALSLPRSGAAGPAAVLYTGTVEESGPEGSFAAGKDHTCAHVRCKLMLAQSGTWIDFVSGQRQRDECE